MDHRMERNQKMLAEGSYGQLLLNLCLPTVVVMLVMIIYNMADTFFIGQTGNPDMMAAISLAMPLFTILSGLGTLFGNGGCTCLSLALGRGESDKAKAYTSFCFYGALVIGLLFTLFVFTCAKPLAYMLGADADTIGYTVQYLRTLSLGGPLVLFSQTFGSCIRCDGSAAKGMVCNLLGTVSNIILDALFIMVFHWDVTGAALATVIGNGISCVYLLFYIRNKKDFFSINIRDLKIKKDICLPVMTLGLPMCFSTVLNSFSHMISNRMLISYGSEAMAAQGVAGKFGMIITMLAMGICMGLQPAISFNFGRKNYKRMSSIIRNTGIFTVTLGTLLSTLIFIFRDTLVTLFINNEAVIAYGQVMVLGAVIVGPFYGLYQLCQVFLQSTGKATYATFVALLDKGLVYLPVLFVMTYLFGLYGIAFTASVTLAFSLVAGAICSFRWNRQIYRQEAAEIRNADENANAEMPEPSERTDAMGNAAESADVPGNAAHIA